MSVGRASLHAVASATIRASIRAAILATSLVAVLPPAAHAQSVRTIPADARSAKLVMASPSAAAPQTATLDGNRVGVAPGLRLFGPDNALVSIPAVAGQKLPVRYQLDLYGQLLTAWVLTEQEQKTALSQPSAR